MADAKEVYDRAMRCLLAYDTNAYADTFAPDAIVEWPFAPNGWPKRLDGRDAIRTHVGAMLTRLQENGRKFVAVHDARAHAIGTHELAVEFMFEITAPEGSTRQPYVHFVRVTDDGKIAALRDYFVPASAQASRAT